MITYFARYQWTKLLLLAISISHHYFYLFLVPHNHLKCLLLILSRYFWLFLNNNPFSSIKTLSHCPWLRQHNLTRQGCYVGNKNGTSLPIRNHWSWLRKCVPWHYPLLRVITIVWVCYLIIPIGTQRFCWYRQILSYLTRANKDRNSVSTCFWMFLVPSKTSHVPPPHSFKALLAVLGQSHLPINVDPIARPTT